MISEDDKSFIHAKATSLVMKLSTAIQNKDWSALNEMHAFIDNVLAGAEKHERALALAVAAACPCRGAGEFKSDCAYCGDSTFEHHCIYETHKCDNAACKMARGILHGDKA